MGDKYDDLLDDFDLDMAPKPKKPIPPPATKPAASGLKKQDTFDDFDLGLGDGKKKTNDTGTGVPKPKDAKPPQPVVTKPPAVTKPQDELWDDFDVPAPAATTKPAANKPGPAENSTDSPAKPPAAQLKPLEPPRKVPDMSESNQNIEKAKSVSGVSDGTQGVPKQYSSTGTDALPFKPAPAVKPQPEPNPPGRKSPSPTREEPSAGRKPPVGGHANTEPNNSVVGHPPSGRRKSPHNPSKSTLGPPTAPLQLPGIANHAAFDSYYSGLNAYDKERFSMLVEKNRKLKEELAVISKATEEIVTREKERKQQHLKWENDADYVELKNLVEDQQYQIHQMKLKIDRKKQELDQAYQYPMIREKEDQLKFLRAQFEQLEKQREGATKVRTEQSKAVGSVVDNRTEQNRKAKLMQDLAELKRDHKLLTEKKVEVDKITSKNHMKLVDAKINIREMEKRLEAYKHNKKSDDPELKTVNKGSVEELKAQLEMLETARRERLINYEKEVRRIEKMKAELRKQMQKMEKSLREKEKDFRLNQVKMKELRRLQRHKASKPAHPAPWERDDPADVEVLLKEQDKEIEARLAELNIQLESSKNSTGGYREAVQKEVAQTQLELKLIQEERAIKEQLEKVRKAKQDLAEQRESEKVQEDAGLSDDPEEPVEPPSAELKPKPARDASPPPAKPQPEPAKQPAKPPSAKSPPEETQTNKSAPKTDMALDPMEDPFEESAAPPPKKKEAFEVVNERNIDPPAKPAGKEPSEIKPNPFTQNKPTFSFKPSLPGGPPGTVKPAAAVPPQNPSPAPAPQQPVAVPTQPVPTQNAPPKPVTNPVVIPKPGLPGGMPKPAVVSGPKPPTQSNPVPAKTQAKTPFQDADDEEFVI